MDPVERQFALDRLAASETRLFALVAGLSPQQGSFRESPDRWSIAENLEHLIRFEEFIRQAVAKALQSAAKPEKQLRFANTQPLVLSLGSPESRQTPLTAREIVRPTGLPSDLEALLRALRDARARTVAWATETRADLHGHFFPHIAFGDLDCYQWLLILGQHTLRHALQIEQIQAHPAYPQA